MKGGHMPFIKIPGLEGKVYVPEEDLKVPKKIFLQGLFFMPDVH